MKECPFCQAEVRIDALKCPSCAELLRCRFCGTPAFYSQRPPRDTAGFGKHLVARGLLTIEHLLATLDRQLALREPIGVVARRLGALTPNQIFEVLNLQRQVHKRFGQLATELGFLSAPAVDELLAEQGRSAPRVGELLVELGYLDAETLGRELSVYHSAVVIEPTSRRAPIVRELRQRR